AGADRRQEIQVRRSGRARVRRSVPVGSMRITGRFREEPPFSRRIRVKTRMTLLVSLALCAISTPAIAHDFWIEPSAFRPSANTPIQIRLRVGEHFAGDVVPRNDAKIERFVMVGPSGEANVFGRDGADIAGLARPVAAGLHVIGYRSKHSSITL